MAGRGIVEKIDGREYIFDKIECVVMFKKLRDVYGSEFCLTIDS